VVALSLAAGARAQEETPSPTREEILSRLAQGEDASNLLRAYASERAGAPTHPAKERSREASDLNAALEAFLQQARSARSLEKLVALVDALDGVRAADRMAREKFSTVTSRLEAAGAAAEIVTRASDAERAYLATAQELMALLEPPFEKIRSGEIPPDEPAIQAAFDAVASAVTLLESRFRREPLTLLRAGVFPYREARLAARPVVVEPPVLPSYLDPADVPPAAEDIEGTGEAPLAEAILQKAEELGYDYVRIFEFVRNDIATEWYSGGSKGAVKTLRDGRGNDVDQASLLIALLRAGQAPARYVHGVIERPVPDLAVEMGVPQSQVPEALARAGVAHEPIVRGGRVAAVELEHTWVSAYVPYTNYRGAVVDFSGKGWVPLAPAIETYSRTPATGILKKMGVSVAAFIADALAVSRPTSPLSRLHDQVVDYLVENAPEETYEQQLGGRSVVPESVGLLPASLPVTVVAVTGESAVLAASHQQRVVVRVRSSEREDSSVVLDYEAPLHELLGERVTLSYQPATIDDHKTVNLFGGLDGVPLYLVRLRPRIQVRGRPEAVGREPIDPGARQRLEIEFTGPFGSERVTQTVVAGSYYAFGITTQRDRKEPDPGGDPGESEFLAARLLSGLALGYSARWGEAEDELAGLLDVSLVRPLPALVIAANAVEVHRLFDLPSELEWQGVTLDAALRVAEPIGDASSDWMRLSALQGSALEHLVFQEDFLVEGISADKGLALAREAGAEILRIDAGNVGTALGLLHHPAEVIADVENWVRLGAVVEIPVDPISLNAWQGSVWRAEDPASGASAYLIAGGLAGGATTVPPSQWILDFLADALNAPNSPAPNKDPKAGVSIVKLGGTDEQSGEVGAILPSELGVLVRDKFGGPVEGARVAFAATRGGGLLIDPETGAEAPGIVLQTNGLGIATARLRLGKLTEDDPIYVRPNEADEHVTQALANEIEAVADSENGDLALDAPFSAIGLPGPAAELLRTNPSRSGGLPAVWSDAISVRVQDQYGNPVSNIPVSFNVGPAQVLPCDPPVGSFNNAAVFDNSQDESGRLVACPVLHPILGECGGPSFTDKTTVFGASAGVILGDSAGARYVINVSAPGLNTFTETYSAGGCAGSPRLHFDTSFSTNEFGDVVNAARVGDEFKEPIEFTIRVWENDYEIQVDSQGNPFVVFLSTGKFVPPTGGEVEFTVSNGGSATPAAVQGNGIYSTTVTTGPTPGQNLLTIHARNFPVLFPTVDGPVEQLLGGTATLNMVWGVDPVIQETTPTPLPLGPTGRTVVPSTTRYQIQPPNYRAASSEADLLEDGEWIAYAIGARTGNGAAIIRRGYPLDVEKEYEIQVTLNRSSTSEVKSEKFPLKLAQQIFSSYSQGLYVSQELDLLNQRSCPLGSEFKFATTQEAKVTLLFKKIGSLSSDGSPNFDSETKLIDDEVFPKGEHVRSITPSDLIAGDYQFELRAISLIDDHQEAVEGFARSEFKVRDSLPVGHAIVKGVDLFEGHLVMMREDFSVPARGLPLDFRRTYSSNSGMEVGTLGVGWSHNWDSRIVITPCGEVIVIGGEGSGMRFVDDGSGGLRPLRGYHGSLVANRDDGSFDFFSKSGVRYHYANLGAVQWRLDFVSDPNGNTVDLTYDTSAGRPRVSSVKDSAGRAIGFRWENRIFAFSSGDVLTSVEGPDGLSVVFEYDGYGNLTRASQEPTGPGGAVREEIYQYAVGPSRSLEERHLLTNVTNTLNGATTEYEYKKAAIGVGPAIRMETYYVDRMREPAGGETSFQVDLAGLESRGPPEMTSVVIDPRGKSTTYTLNQYGSPLRIVDPVGNVNSMTWSLTDVFMESRTDANNVTTFYRYDEHANPTEERVRVQDFDGQIHDYSIETVYWPPTDFTPPHIKDRVRLRKDRNGRTTEYRYDPRGNLIEERIAVESIDSGPSPVVTRHVYDARGDRRATIDPRNFTTSFQYDAFGNLRSFKDPLGRETVTEWTERSLPQLRRDALGRVSRFEHDRLGRPTRTVHPVADSGSAEDRIVYDDRGNTRSQIDAEGRTTKTFYDLEGRVVRVENAEGGATESGYDPAGNKILESNWFDATSPRFDTTFIYDDAGRLSRKVEPLGKVTDFAYDGVGSVKRETLIDVSDSAFEPRVNEYDYDGLNRRIRIRRDLGPRRPEVAIRYDGNGNKVFERDPLGREVFYRYDALNRQIEASEPEWKPGQRKITQALYDGNGNRIEERRLNEPAPQIRRFRYDELNRLKEREDARRAVTYFDYDAVGNLVREVDPRVTVRLHTYDARNRRRTTTVRLDQVTNPPRNVVTSFRYDRVGNLLEERSPNGNVVRHAYDGLNRLVSTEDSLGQLARYEYDARGNRTLDVDANGNRTESFYDALNRVERQELPESKTRRFGYDVVGNRTSETNPRGFTTEMAYDRLDRLVKTTDTAPFRFTVERAYDDAGNKIEERDRRGNTTFFVYDSLNRLTRITDPAPLGFVQEFAYDAVGNQVRAMDRRGIVTETNYDAENRVLSVRRDGLLLQINEYDASGNRRFETDARGTITGFEYDERNLLIAENRVLAAITRYRLDDMGDRVEERDPEGRVTLRTFDARRRLETETNGDGETTEYGYDGNGNRTRLKKPEGNEWTFGYDGVNRLTSVTDPLSNLTQYGYDLNDNRERVEDANSHVTGFEYDEIDRLSAMVYADLAREEYEYDENGNRKRILDAKSQGMAFEYDELNREKIRRYENHAEPTGDDIQSLATTYDPNGNPLSITETYDGPTGVRVTSHTYDNFDRLLTATDPWGKAIRYTYDANGNRTELQDPDGKITRYTFDALNRTETVTPSGVGVTQYTYFRTSLLRSVTYPNGSSARYSYDLANRIRTIDNLQNSAAVSRFEYQYDDNGNRTSQVETRGGSSETTTYVYDDDDRMEEVAYPENTTNYGYDGVGNRRTEQARDTGGTLITDREFDYDERSQLRTLTDQLNAAESVDYDYDANGNQTVKTKGDVATAFAYDVRDNLRTLNQGGSILGRYQYDYSGLRVVKEIPGVSALRYVYDDDSVLLQTDTTGATVAKYDYGPDRLLSMGHATEGRQFYLFDGLGSVSDLMRPDGAIQAAYKYDAWGESRGGIGASSNPFGFTGHERDETGLYYFKARFYDPDVGRFLSEDPAEGDFKNPPSLHKYLYAYGNPTVYVDPDGRIAVVDNAIGGVLSVGVGFAATCFFKGCDKYSWTDAAVDFGLGFASSGLSSLKYLKYAKQAGALANTARVGGRVGAQYSVGFAGEVARHELKGDEYTLGEVSTEAITGALIGEAGDVAAKGVKAAGKAAAKTLAQSESKVGQFLARDLEDLVPSKNRTPSKETVIIGESGSRPGVGVVADDVAESGARSASDAATPPHISGETPPAAPGATSEAFPSRGPLPGEPEFIGPVPPLGGAHKQTSVAGKQFGTESHHLIAESVSDLAKGAAPAIRLPVPAHQMTASHGHRGLTGKAFRQQQEALVKQGRYDEALRMGIDDIRRLPDAELYEPAIQQMLKGLPRRADGTIDWSKIPRKKR
jgi:RHS repeat-associated protein